MQEFLFQEIPKAREKEEERQWGNGSQKRCKMWISCLMDTQACEALRGYPSESPPKVTRLGSLSTNSHTSHPEHPSLPSVPPQMGWAELPKQGSAQADSPWASGCGQVRQLLPHLLTDSWSRRQVNAAWYLRGTTDLHSVKSQTALVSWQCSEVPETQTRAGGRQAQPHNDSQHQSHLFSAPWAPALCLCNYTCWF